MHKDQVNMYTTLKNPNITFDSAIISYPRYVLVSATARPVRNFLMTCNCSPLFYGVFNTSRTVLLTGYPISRDIDKI